MKVRRIEGRDIVIVGQQPWDTEIGSNCKNIAIEMSKTNRVLYVNAPLDTKTLLKQRNETKVQKRIAVLKGREQALQPVGKNLWTLYPDISIFSINWMPGGFLFDYLLKINNKRFAGAIRRALQKLDFNSIILFNDSDFIRSFYLKEYLKPDTAIYYSRDYLMAVDYWKKHGTRLEPALITKSDFCVANSAFLADYCKQYNPRSYNVGQGCDLELFEETENVRIPEDLENIPRPIIGYVGALQSIRLDIDLLHYISRERPGWSLVLVGPEDEEFKQSILHRQPNVFFTGAKAMETLPSYINSFDVCLNPQLINDVTRGNYPRKIDEYLALGKPVVASRTEAMLLFKDYTYLAETGEEYLALIEKAMSENSEQLKKQRKAFAASHSWENNVNEIYKVLNAYQQSR